MNVDENFYNTYMDILMEFNMCSIDVIYKYNLSSAIKDTRDLITSDNWKTALDNADEEQFKGLLGATLDPISSQLFKVSGQELVDMMPQELL